MKINSYQEWREKHPESYRRAVRLGIQKETAELMGWEYQENNPFLKKQKLINMMINGDPKPSQKTNLGSVLNNYIRRDNNFRQMVNKYWPNQRDSSKTKRRLVELILNGEPRPMPQINGKSNPDNTALKRYYHKDKKFAKIVDKYWPQKTTELEQLILLAHKNTPKNKIPSFLNNAKSKYRDDLIKIAPKDWYINHLTQAQQKKQKLINMMLSGKAKPKDKKTNQLMQNYKRTDDNFKKMVDKYWPKQKGANYYKTILINIAKNGQPKIQPNHYLYSRYMNYINDPIFKKEISRFWPSGRVHKKVICLNNMKTYNSLADAAKILKLNYKSLHSAIKKAQSIFGYTFEWVEE
jgi:hypothetical protein